MVFGTSVSGLRVFTITEARGLPSLVRPPVQTLAKNNPPEKLESSNEPCSDHLDSQSCKCAHNRSDPDLADENTDETHEYQARQKA